MAGHTVRAFDEELEEITREVRALGDAAVTQLDKALTASLKQNSAAAGRIIAADAKLDARAARIEQMAARLIALRQPMADDLRCPLVAIKVALNLERCGDLAKNIAKRGRLVPSEVLEPALTRAIEELGRLVVARLSRVLSAYGAADIEGAISVWTQDADIDASHEALSRDILAAMAAAPEQVEAGMHLLFMVKNLERIGDHATNIAELVYYQVTGEDLGGDRPKRDPLVAAPRA